MDSRIAQRYALALLGIGHTKGSVATFTTDLQSIADTLHGSAELRATLHSPVIRPDIKRKLLKEIFAKNISSDTLQFVDLLVRKGRASLLGSVAEEFQKLLDTETGTINARIVSARELDQSAKETIVKRLESLVSMKIRPIYAVDATLRGGFTAQVGDTFIDASLQHQLENLREEWKHPSSVQLN